MKQKIFAWCAALAVPFPTLVEQISSSWEIDVKSIPNIVISIIAFTFIQNNISVIFTGGAGKNGSTVAVRDD